MTNCPAATYSNLKLIEPALSMIEGEKFLKWTESNSEKLQYYPVGVTLRIDECGFLLYWRELYQDERIYNLLSSGRMNVPVQDKTVTIIFGTEYSNLQTINFVAMTNNPVESAQKWTKFLLEAAYNKRMQNLSPWDSIQKLRSWFLYAIGTYDEKKQQYSVPVQTIFDAFISSVNPYSITYESEKLTVTRALKAAGLPHRKNDLIEAQEFTLHKFSNLVIGLILRDPFDDVILKYGTKKSYMNAEQLAAFINKDQRYSGLNELLYPFCQVPKASQIINKFEIDEFFNEKNLMSSAGLIRYLMEFENGALDPVKYDLSDDMDQPLTDYFINTSHNTYLTGHQITGRSDPEMYKQVLISGCRCIELDCHEDDMKIEPIITHGRTFCTKISFVEVVKAINEAAFKTSPYPVILSFENYCGKKLQEKMARYLSDIFGDKLLTEPLRNFEPSPGCRMPSPENLKYKILVKFSIKKSSSKQENDLVLNDSGSDDETSLDSDSSTRKKSDSQTSQFDMISLVNYIQPFKFQTFELAEKLNRPYLVSSLSESSALKLINENPIDFVRLNQNQFTRIYPKGTRISSDNFLPHIYWSAGCQMVALNFQTLDLGMQLNNGKFDLNNRSGYLLKPGKLRSSPLINTFNPLTQSLIDGIVCLRMNIKILSGLFINFGEKRFGQSISLEIFGLPNDSVIGSKSHRVTAAKRKNFNVSYDDEGFEIHRILFPEMALIKVTAYDQSNKMIAFAVLPVSSLRAGYRYVSLKNQLSQPTLMNLVLLKIQIDDYVTKDMEDFASALVNPEI